MGEEVDRASPRAARRPLRLDRVAQTRERQGRVTAAVRDIRADQMRLVAHRQRRLAGTCRRSQCKVYVTLRSRVISRSGAEDRSEVQRTCEHEGVAALERWYGDIEQR